MTKSSSNSNVLLNQLNVTEALTFFNTFMYKPHEMTKQLRWEYEFYDTGLWVAPRLWELFVAILNRQKKAQASYGHDLEAAEVKSMRSSSPGDREAYNNGIIERIPRTGSGWEYQYHRNAGTNKLSSEVRVDHVLIRYTADLSHVEVYCVPGSSLLKIFNSWSAALKANYKKKAAQRFRKSIGVKIVKDPKKATLLLRIEKGVITEKSNIQLSSLFPSVVIKRQQPAPAPAPVTPKPAK